MRMTDALRGEHGVFYALFGHLEETLPDCESLGEVSAQAAFLTSALATHANIEETLLFTTLEPHLGKAGPLAVMRSEHEEIEGTLEGFAGIEDLSEAKRQLLHVVSVARGHFGKEEQILYKLAEQTLDEGVLSDLGMAWAKKRRVLI